MGQAIKSINLVICLFPPSVKVNNRSAVLTHTHRHPPLQFALLSCGGGKSVAHLVKSLKEGRGFLLSLNNLLHHRVFTWTLVTHGYKIILLREHTRMKTHTYTHSFPHTNVVLPLKSCYYCCYYLISQKLNTHWPDHYCT